MAGKLVNVRLDADRLRKVRRLRERGVALSDLVREAIDHRFDRLDPAVESRQARATLDRILERHPDPPDLPPRDYDVHDRRQARIAIAERLRRRAGRRP
jgi:hypothetical protein